MVSSRQTPENPSKFNGFRGFRYVLKMTLLFNFNEVSSRLAQGADCLLVCHCKGLTDRAVRRTVNSGACSVAEVMRSCGAGGICGGCRPAIQEIVDDASAPRTVRHPFEGLELSAAR